MKKVFLILIAIIITVSMILIGVGCKTAASAQPVIPEFTGGDFELSLPEKWEGGNKEEIDSVIEKLKDAGQTELADRVEASKLYLVFFGYDTEMAALGGDVNVFTITGESKVFLSLENYMDLAYKDVAEEYEKAGYTFDIIEQGIVTLGSNEEVGRTIFEQTIEDTKTKVAQYIIKHESDIWVLTFTVDLEQFDDNVQNFDKTIETFRIID